LITPVIRPAPRSPHRRARQAALAPESVHDLTRVAAAELELRCGDACMIGDAMPTDARARARMALAGINRANQQFADRQAGEATMTLDQARRIIDNPSTTPMADWSIAGRLIAKHYRDNPHLLKPVMFHDAKPRRPRLLDGRNHQRTPRLKRTPLVR
jgi:hypothetical protein